MQWLQDKLRKWLFPQELLSLKASQQREAELLNLLQSFKDSAAEREGQYAAIIEAFNEMENEGRRMTLKDFILTPGEQIELKGCSSAFRHALWKAGEHICLTTVSECCRKTAVAYRKYQRDLTLSPSNRVKEIDETTMDKAQERSKKFFTPRDAPAA